MRLYTTTGAPNPRRVHLFLAEKGIDLPTELISLREGQQFSDEYGRINPDRVVPTLVLDDGTAIGESLAICRYLEAVHPDPPLFGKDPREVGLVEMWIRRVELQGYQPVQEAYRNSRTYFEGRAFPGFSSGLEQIPELVGRSNAMFRRLLARLDGHLRGHEFIVGDGVTMADIVALTTLDFAQRTKMEVVGDLAAWPEIQRWHTAMGSRSSASAEPASEPAASS